MVALRNISRFLKKTSGVFTPISPNHIAAIFDPLGNAMHTVMAAGVSGRSVLITGVGIIGLMAVTIAKAAGAAKIIVSDVDEKRLHLAKELGADIAFTPLKKIGHKKRLKQHKTKGVHVLLEMSGHPSGIHQGFTALRSGGTAAMLGLPAKRLNSIWRTRSFSKGQLSLVSTAGKCSNVVPG